MKVANELIADDLFGEPETEPQPAEPETTRPVAGRIANKAAMVFDIETGPVASDELEDLFEFDPTSLKGHDLLGAEFDPASVKLGNLKDKQKIKDKIEAERQKFDRAKAGAETAIEEARETAWLSFIDKAALSPLTGQVLAIGVWWSSGSPEPALYLQGEDGFESETNLLAEWWDLVRDAISTDSRLIGFNSDAFDLPFLVRRSWKLGVVVPPEVIGNGRWHRCFIDLMRQWACGVYGERVSMDRLAAYFGCTRKNGEAAEFARLFHGTDEERKQAVEYLRNDLRMTLDVADRMNVI